VNPILASRWHVRPIYKNFLHENRKPHTDATCVVFTKISCTKTESPTLVAEWYVHMVMEIFCAKMESHTLVAELNSMYVQSLYQNGNP